MGNHYAMFFWHHNLHNVGDLQATSSRKSRSYPFFNGLESCSQAYLPWSSNASMLKHASNTYKVARKLSYTHLYEVKN
jgi:hypothetical protein